MAIITELFELLNPLADPTRYKIVKELLSHDYCVGGLARTLRLTEAAVSQHLMILKKAGIITGEKRSYFMHYQVNQDLLKQVALELLKMSEISRTNSSSCPTSAKENCPLCSSLALAFGE